MLMYQTNLVVVQLFFYVNTFICSIKFAWLLETRVNTLNVKHQPVPRQGRTTTLGNTCPTLLVISSLAFVKAENYILV